MPPPPPIPRRNPRPSAAAADTLSRPFRSPLLSSSEFRRRPVTQIRQEDRFQGPESQGEPAGARELRDLTHKWTEKLKDPKYAAVEQQIQDFKEVESHPLPALSPHAQGTTDPFHKYAWRPAVFPFTTVGTFNESFNGDMSFVAGRARSVLRRPRRLPPPVPTRPPPRTFMEVLAAQKVRNAKKVEDTKKTLEELRAVDEYQIDILFEDCQTRALDRDWTRVARTAAEMLFENFDERVRRMGGSAVFHAQQRQRARMRSGDLDQEDTRERETNFEEAMNLGVMLTHLNIDHETIGWNAEKEDWDEIM